VSSSASIYTGWLNVRSLGNKAKAVRELITDDNLDIVVLSETWHVTPDAGCIQKVKPCGYTLFDAVREKDPHHGGLAILLCTNFTGSRIALSGVYISKFECLAVQVAIGGLLLVVVAIYRPGSERPVPQFFDELTELLEFIVQRKCPFVIGGDFNIHVEDPSDPNAKRLTSVLAGFGLEQRVERPTHRRGGTLDVVILPKEIANVSVTVAQLWSKGNHSYDVTFDHGLVVAQLLTTDLTAFSTTTAVSHLGKASSSDKAAGEPIGEHERVLTVLIDSFSNHRLPGKAVYIPIPSYSHSINFVLSRSHS